MAGRKMNPVTLKNKMIGIDISNLPHMDDFKKWSAIFDNYNLYLDSGGAEPRIIRLFEKAIEENFQPHKIPRKKTESLEKHFKRSRIKAREGIKSLNKLLEYFIKMPESRGKRNQAKLMKKIRASQEKYLSEFDLLTEAEWMMQTIKNFLRKHELSADEKNELLGLIYDRLVTNKKHPYDVDRNKGEKITLIKMIVDTLVREHFNIKGKRRKKQSKEVDWDSIKHKY